MKNKQAIFLIICLLFCSIQVHADNYNDKNINKTFNSDKNACFYCHSLQSISLDGLVAIFENDLSFTINWWYRSVPQNWEEGDLVYISFDFQSKLFKLEHATLHTIAWGEIKSFPSSIPLIKAMPNATDDPDRYSIITLDNGYTFKSTQPRLFGDEGWKVKDRVVILANSHELYQLWNREKNQMLSAKFVANQNQVEHEPFEIKDILSLEDRLNDQVLQQPEATQTVVASLLNYTAGIKEKERPVGVFLFIGPTGVGKTELAKVLANEIYGNASTIVRFDMSHFTEHHTISRLIGSPPGYVNHEEGGQLTNPLLKNSQMIVLLDEIEKAHPQVIKTFLPVFDEGFILDTKNNHISCSDTIFIMTSNLCSNQIVELYNLGYSSEQILEAIEPQLMEALSPELYNRVEPILFHPLLKSTMNSLVDLMLNKLEKRLLMEKQIQIYVDDSLKSFLVENGYHPLLGARPLKKLIEKRVLSTLAYTLIKERIGNNCEILLLYDQETDSVIVQKL